jgi:hypothetical protein
MLFRTVKVPQALAAALIALVACAAAAACAATASGQVPGVETDPCYRLPGAAGEGFCPTSPAQPAKDALAPVDDPAGQVGVVVDWMALESGMCLQEAALATAERLADPIGGALACPLVTTRATDPRTARGGGSGSTYYLPTKTRDDSESSGVTYSGNFNHKTGHYLNAQDCNVDGYNHDDCSGMIYYTNRANDKIRGSERYFSGRGAHGFYHGRVAARPYCKLNFAFHKARHNCIYYYG